jgi:mannosyltransferase
MSARAATSLGRRGLGSGQGILVALAGLMLLSLALHLHALEAKSIWWDESLSLYRAQRPLAYILSNRIDFPGAETIDLHPPLYFLILRFFICLFGERDFVLRFPSVLAGTAIVPLLYVMGSRLRNPRAGLFAAALGALSPFYLWYAQEARMYTLVTALSLASLYCLWRAASEHSLRWTLGFSLAAAAAISTQYLYALILAWLLLLAALLWFRLGLARSASPLWATRQRRWVLLGAAILLALVLLAAGMVAWQQALGPQAGRKYVPLPLMLRDALNSFCVGLSVSLIDAWPLLCVGAVVYALGVVAIWRHPPPVRRGRWVGVLLMLGYVLVPIAGMWAYSLFRSLYMGSRYVIMTSPGFYLGVGVGLDALARRARPAAWLVLAVLLGGMVWSDLRYFTHERYATKEDYRSAAMHVYERERPGEVIILTAPENMPAFKHYYQGDLPVIGIPLVALHPEFDPAQLAQDLAQALESYDRVWFVHCRTQHSDPEDQVWAWLEANASLLSYKHFPSWGSSPMVRHYMTHSPKQAAPPPAALPLATFGGALRLQGVTAHYRDTQNVFRLLTPNPDDGKLAPMSEGPLPAGSLLNLTLDWYADKDLVGLKTSLRLRDGRDVVWSQRDRPFFDYAPEDRLASGTRITHPTTLDVPLGLPPGEYTLELVVYDGASGAPLTALIAGQTEPASSVLTLGTVAIGREARSTPLTDDDLDGARRVPQRSVFGGATELLARRLTPSRAKAGDTVGLHLIWRALRPTRSDLQMVVNLRDAQGGIRPLSTTPLVGLPYARQNWARGELVRGLVLFSLPEDLAPGKYTVHLLVREETRGRFQLVSRGLLPWSGRDVLVAQLTVVEE